MTLFLLTEFQKVVVETLMEIRDELKCLNNRNVEEGGSLPEVPINSENHFRKVAEDQEDPPTDELW